MKNCAATEDVRKKPGGIYMMVKVAVPEKFKLRIVPNVQVVLAKSECYHKGFLSFISYSYEFL